MHRLPASMLAVIGLIALAGCTGGEPMPAPDLDVSASPAPAPPADEPDDTAEPEPSDPFDPACLVGEWVIPQSEMQRFYDDAVADSPELRFIVEGDTGLWFDEETYVYTPEFTLTLELVDLGATGSGATSGSLAGSYLAELGIITTRVESNNVTIALTVMGQQLDGTELLGSIIASDPVNEAIFECGPDGPVIQFSHGSGSTPVALRPVG